VDIDEINSASLVAGEASNTPSIQETPENPQGSATALVAGEGFNIPSNQNTPENSPGSAYSSNAITRRQPRRGGGNPPPASDANPNNCVTVWEKRYELRTTCVSSPQRADYTINPRVNIAHFQGNVSFCADQSHSPYVSALQDDQGMQPIRPQLWNGQLAGTVVVCFRCIFGSTSLVCRCPSSVYQVLDILSHYAQNIQFINFCLTL
jgi:hypothetical protein